MPKPDRTRESLDDLADNQSSGQSGTLGSTTSLDAERKEVRLDSRKRTEMAIEGQYGVNLCGKPRTGFEINIIILNYGLHRSELLEREGYVTRR